ncbi:MAG: ABC transporter permease [Paracoccaceae bacterium]
MNWRDFRIWGQLPALTIMALALIVPICIVLLVSFGTRGSYGGFSFGLSPAAYQKILFAEDWSGNLGFNPQYLIIIGRTVTLALLTTLFCLILAFPVAYYIARQKPEVKSVLIYLVTLPFWVSMIVRVYAWLIILGNGGLVDRLLLALGLISQPGGILFTNTAMLIGLVYSYIPLMILPVFASIEKLDPALVEASHDLYGGRWTTLRRVIVPGAWPGLMAGAVLVFVPALGSVLEPILLGGGKVMMMGNLIQRQFGGDRDWPFGSAIALCLMAVVIIVLTINAQRAARQERLAA